MQRAVVVIGSLIACDDSSSVTVDREPICVPGDDAALFSSLTAQRWGACGQNIGLCLALSADGTYVSDRGEGDYRVVDTGRWNFLARDASSGVVCLDDGSVVAFALEAAGLQWGVTGALAARDSLPANGVRDALPTLLPADEFFNLTAHAWAKTNELDLYGYPTEVALHRDGTFDATFRGGACAVTGTFSLFATPDGGELNPRVAPNTCDTRGGGTTANIAASNEQPRIEAGVLRFYGASYRDAALTTDERSLVFASYGDDAGLRVEASWNGALAAGAPTTWKFALRNPTPRSQTATSLTLTLTPLVETTGGFSTSGPAATVLDQAFNGMVPSGDSYTTSGEVTFSGSGLVMLEIDVSSYDDRQRYDNQRHFIFSL